MFMTGHNDLVYVYDRTGPSHIEPSRKSIMQDSERVCYVQTFPETLKKYANQKVDEDYQPVNLTTFTLSI